MNNRTFSMIKPDATARNMTGKINTLIEDAGFRIVAQKRVHLSQDQAKAFYAVHKERPFYGELVEMMSAAPVVVQILESENAVSKYRDLMGATNPDNAEAGTIRKTYGLSLSENSVHGSDSDDNAKIEMNFFFSACEIVG